VAEGGVGAGAGAQAGPLKGGVGTASVVLDSGITVGALLAVNARGHAVDPATGIPYGTAFLLPGELTLTTPGADAIARASERLAGSQKMARLNTVIGVVATDAPLTKAECRKVAEMAHDGLARAIRPAHTPFDGDTLFCLATGTASLASPAAGGEYAAAASRPAILGDIGEAAATTVARAVVRALAAAQSTDRAPSYRDAYELDEGR
jgi:L-aminopeptidase/D-esterase-like protein